jgi:peptidoglycan/LPS O-acetylase OafA/YrhL
MQSIVQPSYRFYSILNKPALSLLGVLSYSIYIWQMIFCTNPASFGLGQVWWMSFPYWLLPVAAVAALSYFGFELQFQRLRAFFRD